MEFVYEVEGGDFTKAGNASSAVKKNTEAIKC